MVTAKIPLPPREFSRSPKGMSQKKMPATTATGDSDDTQASKLQKELNEISVKHNEELYWLRLELNATRREKEAVEDRMAELYRDIQEIEDSKPTRSRPLIVDADYVVELQNQLEKYERMLRIMNNQISLIRGSSDTVVKSLKEEISDLMDEKCRMEMDLMNQLTDLDKEKRDLTVRIQIAEQHGPSPTSSSRPTTMTTSKKPQNGLHSTAPADAETKQLKAEIQRLKKEKKKLASDLSSEHKKLQESQNQWKQEKIDLSGQIDKLQKDIGVLRSSAESSKGQNTKQQNRDETAAMLERKAGAEMKQLEAEVHRLRNEKKQLAYELSIERKKLHDSQNHWKRQKTELAGQIERIGKDMEALRTSAESSKQETLKQRDRDETLAMMERKNDAEMKELQSEVQRLRKENKQLASELSDEQKKLQDSESHSMQQKAELASQVERIEMDIIALRTSAESVSAETLNQMQQDRDETLTALERVAQLWDRADDSIQGLESAMMELRPHDGRVDEDRERLLSTLETASLVHGQVKVSLMLAELKLRNNLACLKNDQLQLGALAPSESTISERMNDIRSEAMASIMQVEAIVNKQIEQLAKQSAEETKVVRESLETKVEELKRMQTRQTKLEEEISKLQSEGEMKGEKEEENNSTASLELFVSRQVLQKLQSEVLQIVERVKEKDESIGRLTAVVEEHKVRERTLMDELRRHMREQAQRQLEEQQRIMDNLAESQGDDDEDETSNGGGAGDGSSACDSSSAPYVGGSVAEEVDGSVVQEEIVDEETYVEEIIEEYISD